MKKTDEEVLNDTKKKAQYEVVKKSFLFVFLFFSFGFFFLFFSFSIFDKGVLHAACFSVSSIHSPEGKSLQDMYFSLRRSVQKKCKLTSSDFLFYGERAVVANRCAETLWAAEQGLKRKPASDTEKYKLTVLKGRAFLCLKRTEEAISTLKKIAQNKTLYTSRQFSDITFSAHLLFIKAYYMRANQKKDANVIYLLHLLKKRYSQKHEIGLTNKW